MPITAEAEQGLQPGRELSAQTIENNLMRDEALLTEDVERDLEVKCQSSGD